MASASCNAEVTGQEVFVVKKRNDRKMQRAMLQFFKPENSFMIRSGRDALIPANPPMAVWKDDTI